MELTGTKRNRPALLFASLLATVATITALALALASHAGAVTVGTNLNQTPAFGAGCEVSLISNALPAPPSCSMFDPVSGQTRRGQWRVVSARVRTGPRTGPMRFTMIQALRSRSGAGGVICCTASSQGPVFTPRANSVTRVNLNLPAVSTTVVIDREQVEVVDYLGITLLNQAGSIAFAPAQPAATTFFDRAFTTGVTRLGGAIPYSVVPMINAELRPCRALGSAAATSATVCAPLRFAVSQRARLAGNGTSARITVAVPRAGRLAVNGAGSATRLVRGSRSNPKRAGRFKLALNLNARGKRKLARSGSLTLRARVTFNPRGGKARSKTVRIRFRR